MTLKGKARHTAGLAPAPVGMRDDEKRTNRHLVRR